VALKDKKLNIKSVFKTLKPKAPKGKIFAPLRAVGGYLKGSWQELRLVRWPNRRSTWGMTAAVILFTALFLGLIVALDAIFSQLFNLILK